MLLFLVAAEEYSFSIDKMGTKFPELFKAIATSEIVGKP